MKENRKNKFLVVVSEVSFFVSNPISKTIGRKYISMKIRPFFLLNMLGIFRRAEELNFCLILRFSNPYIFETQCHMTLDISNYKFCYI